MDFHFGALNIVMGWIVISIGIISGSFLGMFAFGGPFPAPKGWESYDSLPRRMVRLAHIAFIMLPVLNILFGQFVDQSHLTDGMKQFGSYCMIFGMFGVPIFLILGAVVWLGFKYVAALPVTATLIGLLLMGYGYYPYLN